MAVNPYVPTDSVSDPSIDAFAIVPHDTDPLPAWPKAIYVGAGGDITCKAVSGSADVVFVNVPQGSVLPVRVSHVRATGTTASSLIGL